MRRNLVTAVYRISKCINTEQKDYDQY